MTEPERDEAGTFWLRRTVTVSHWSLAFMVLGTGAIVAIAGLATAAIFMLLVGNRGLEAVLATGVVLAVTAVARLLIDLRRLLRIRARHKRVSMADDGEDP